VAADKGLFRQRRERRPFGRKEVQGSLARRGVHDQVELVGHERGQRTAESVEVRPGVALDEVLFEVEEGPLDLALRLRPARLARHRLNAVVTAQFQKMVVPGEAGGVGRGHQGPVVVDQQTQRRTAEVAQARLQRLVDRRLRGVQTRPVELAAAVAQNQPEHHDLGRHVAQHDGVERPVELSLLAGAGLVTLGDALVRRLLDAAQVRIDRRRAAVVAQQAQLADDARTDEMLLDRHVLDLLEKGCQLRIRPRRPRVVGRGFRIESRTDGVARHPQFLGNAANGFALRAQVANGRPGFHGDHLLRSPCCGLTARMMVSVGWVNFQT